MARLSLTVAVPPGIDPADVLALMQGLADAACDEAGVERGRMRHTGTEAGDASVLAKSAMKAVAQGRAALVRMNVTEE